MDEEQAQPAGSHHPCNHQMYQLLASKMVHLAMCHIINPTGKDSGVSLPTVMEEQRGRNKNRAQKPPHIIHLR